MTLHLGTGQWTIPAGTFHRDRQGRFKFEGFVGLTVLEAVIRPLPDGSFEFKAEGRGAELTGIANPVSVSLTIGNDGGTTSVLAEIE